MAALFSTFGIDWHLLIAQGVNFAILAAGLTYFLYTPVLKMVRERQQIVAKGVEDAERASEQLKAADTDAAARLRKAEEESAATLARAKAEAGEARTQILAEAAARAEQLAKDAELRASEHAERAKRESEREIARLAVLAAEKVLASK